MNVNDNEYAAFYKDYIEPINGCDVISILKNQVKGIEYIKASISEDNSAFAYAEGKWSIKEIFGHLADSERIFGYRFLTILRNDKVEMPGFEEDDYVREAEFKNREFSDIADELIFLRKANLRMFESAKENDLDKKGIANNHSVTLRGLLFIIAGHFQHHLNVLETKYLIKR